MFEKSSSSFSAKLLSYKRCADYSKDICQYRYKTPIKGKNIRLKKCPFAR
jgi:hypothetical protein